MTLNALTENGKYTFYDSRPPNDALNSDGGIFRITQRVWSKVVGSKSDRTTADGKYLIIGNEGKEFIISDGSGIYKTGKQIITSKVTTTVGEAATTEIRNITLNDESPIEALEKLKEVKRSHIYLNGELTVDFPEDVRIPIEPNQMATAVLSGNKIKFEYCGLDRAIALLNGQYAVGTVEIKIVQLRIF